MGGQVLHLIPAVAPSAEKEIEGGALASWMGQLWIAHEHCALNTRQFLALARARNCHSPLVLAFFVRVARQPHQGRLQPACAARHEGHHLLAGDLPGR
jgi:hypothetical protein